MFSSFIFSVKLSVLPDFPMPLFWIYFILKPSSAALRKNKLGFLWQAHFMVQCHSLSEDGEEYDCEPSAWVLD
jgi:hypothetical protein